MKTKVKPEHRAKNICYCGGFLVDHRGKEYEPHQIECIDCGKEFSTMGNPWDELEEVTRIWETEESFKCNVCGTEKSQEECEEDGFNCLCEVI